MQRTTSTNNVGSLPTYASGGETPGYYTDLVSGGPGTSATLVGASDLNLLQEELVSVILAAGLTLDGADATQLLQAVGGALGLKSHATSTGSATTTHLRAVIASTSSTASGAESAVIASESSTASVAESVVVASYGSAASGVESAVISSDGSTASAQRTAVVASQGGVASGDSAAVIASDDSTAGGGESVVIASATSSTAGGSKSAVVASTGCVVVGGRSMLVGSTNAELASYGVMALGYSGASLTPAGSDQNITIALTAETGEIACQELDVNNGVALGGGAAPTLGTIGGSGPTAAAQSKWLEIKIGGTSHWIPVWV